ncbi:ATP-binding protein [Glutamicibacter sp. X7]
MARTIDTQLASALSRSGAVVLEGPKACGKTATCLQASKSHSFLDTDPNVDALYSINPGLLLEGPTPRLLDEWQLYPELWNHARRAVDERQSTGQFILAGSTVPAAEASRHSGAGRFSRLRMRSMTLQETGHSTGSLSFADLIAGVEPSCAENKLELSDLIDRLARGGWPGLQNRSLDDAIASNRDYLRNFAYIEVKTIQGPIKDPARIARLFRSLARSTASEIKIASLARDVDTTRDTVRLDLDVLERAHLSEPQPAWSTHLRSSATLRKEPKRHLADPSLAVAALSASPQVLMQNLNFTGELYESQVVHDLRVFADARDARIFHARDSQGHEVDAIAQFDDGSWHGFEIKLGQHPDVLDQAAKSLKTFANNVDAPDSCKGLTILTNTDYSYRRKDGVNVVSIASLGA